MLLLSGVDNGLFCVVMTLCQEVRKTAHLDFGADHLRREVLEGSVVREQFVVGLGVPGKIERHLASARGTKGDLLADDGFATARWANDHNNRAAQETAAENEVEVRDASLETLSERPRSCNELHRRFGRPRLAAH